MGVKSIDVLVDPDPQDGSPPVIGLRIEPVAGYPFVMPLTFESAREMASMILQTLIVAAPEMFFHEDLAEGLKAGHLTFSDVLDMTI
jgi:hypothetical protein